MCLPMRDGMRKQFVERGRGFGMRGGPAGPPRFARSLQSRCGSRIDTSEQACIGSILNVFYAVFDRADESGAIGRYRTEPLNVFLGDAYIAHPLHRIFSLGLGRHHVLLKKVWTRPSQLRPCEQTQMRRPDPNQVR